DQLNHITFYWTVLPNPASERYTAAVDSFYAIRKGAGATELVKTDWTVNVLNTYSGAAADIIDGDEATWWNSNGNTTSWIAWAEIDMQKLKMIKSIRIACSHSVKYGYLYASETQPGSWPGDAPLIGTIVRETTNWETLFYWDIPLGAPINAQYLYLYLSDSHQYGYHLIYEVYLNGYSE
ncbi:MAG: hypothetical protein LBS03_00080, partial [Bacteroidales bacterium]|nr:hypothetical protein [Bacteroidales bacterium]